MLEKFLRLLIVLALASCSTNQLEEYFEVQNEDLVETFDVSDDKAQKFTVEKVIDPIPAMVISDSSSIDSTEKTNKKTSRKEQDKTNENPRQTQNKKIVEKKTTGPEKSKPLKKTKDIKLPKKTKVPEFKYPKDYPAVLKKYDKKSRPLWKKFTPRFKIGEKETYQVYYSGIPIGTIALEVKPRVQIAGKTAYHFHGELKSAKYYEMIYRLEDSVDSFVNVENFLPLKYSLKQRETKKVMDDLQLFDRDDLKTFYWYKKEKDGKKSEGQKVESIPYFFTDTFGPLYFVRGLPLVKGAKYEFPVVTRAKIWLTTVKVLGLKEVRINKKWTKAIKLRAINRFPGIEKKRSVVYFWITNDKKRRMLKFEGELKLGSVSGEVLEKPSN